MLILPIKELSMSPMHQADCGVFVLLLLVFFTSVYRFTKTLSLGEFQSIFVLVQDNTATLEQEWTTCIRPCCYIWRDGHIFVFSFYLREDIPGDIDSCICFYL